MLPGPGAGWALAVLVIVGICAVAALPIASAQEPVVQTAAIWSDTVKLGDMQRAVRGLGVLTTATTAELKVAETQTREIVPGQAVALGFRARPELAAGHVARVGSTVANGTVTVDVRVEGSLPPGISAPEQVDGIIEIERLANIVHVGRPVFGQAGSEITLFKIEPDGKSAVRTKVQLGRSSVNVIEVRSGLQPGDRVILSDMSAYKNVDRVTLR
jgi:HlyD family secretion protein